MKLTSNNLTIPDSILILEFIVISTAWFKVLLFLFLFFLCTKCQNHGKNNSWYPNIFTSVMGLGVFNILVFQNHLKLVNSIPEKLAKQVEIVKSPVTSRKFVEAYHNHTKTKIVKFANYQVVKKVILNFQIALLLVK